MSAAEARAAVDLIREAAGAALDGEGAPSGAWSQRGRGDDRVWSRRPPGEVACFVSEGALPGPVKLAAALIKEADLGGLAGDLRRWKAVRVSPCLELLSYTSRLPWPLADRSFSVIERYGGGPGEAWVLGQDLRGASLEGLPAEALAALQAEAAEPDTVGGSVLCSAYRIRATATGCRLRRVTRIELHLPMPASWTEALLARTFLDDLEKLRAGLARPPEGIAARMEGDPIYGVW